MKRQINFGFSSILISFIMICIVTFSALSLITANADYKLSQKVAKRNRDYYEADGQCHEHLAELDKALATIYEEVSSPEAYFDEAKYQITAGTWTEVDAVSATYTFTQPISDNQYLEVELLVQYPNQYTRTFYHVMKWRSYMEEEPYEEQPLNVMGFDN